MLSPFLSPTSPLPHSLLLLPPPPSLLMKLCCQQLSITHTACFRSALLTCCAYCPALPTLLSPPPPPPLCHTPLSICAVKLVCAAFKMSTNTQNLQRNSRCLTLSHSPTPSLLAACLPTHSLLLDSHCWRCHLVRLSHAKRSRSGMKRKFYQHQHGKCRRILTCHPSLLIL